MTIQFIQLFDPNVVNSTTETLYTVPSTPTSTILRNARVRFANTTAGAVSITAWAVPSGGSAADATCCLPVVSIAAYGYIDVDVPVIAAGGTIRAQAGAATSITATSLDGFLQS
jgi:hypothetical protein